MCVGKSNFAENNKELPGEREVPCSHLTFEQI